MVGARRKVPGTSVQQPLIELLVHGQDIAVPLGIDLSMPTDAAQLAPIYKGLARQANSGARLLQYILDNAEADGSGPVT